MNKHKLTDEEKEIILIQFQDVSNSHSIKSMSKQFEVSKYQIKVVISDYFESLKKKRIQMRIPDEFEYQVSDEIYRIEDLQGDELQILINGPKWKL